MTAAPSPPESPALAAAQRVQRSPFAIGFTLTLGALLAFALGTALVSLSTILISIVLALFVALGLDPAVRFFVHRGLRRPLAIALVFVIFAIVIVGVLLLIVPTVVRQTVQFVQGIPDAIREFSQSELYAQLQDRFGDAMQSATTQVQAFVVDPANLAAIGGGALQLGFNIVTAISGLVIVLVLSLYFLASLDQMKYWLTRLVAAYNRPGLLAITEQVTASIGGFLTGMFILAFANSLVVLVLYLLLGLPYPALVAVAAFFITLIPLIGPVLFWVIGSVMALFTSPVSALIFAVVYLVYMQVEAYVLTPRVMSRAVSIPGSLVVIGAMVGGTLLGLLGAFVAIPVTASLLLILKQVVIPRLDAKITPPGRSEVLEPPNADAGEPRG